MSAADVREALARVISDAESTTDGEGAWALSEDSADAILSRFDVTPKGQAPADARAEAERRWPHTGDATVDTARAARRLSFVQGAEWRASQPVTDEQVDRVAAAIAKAQNADYWTDEISEWESSEEWHREAYPNEYPGMAYEDREHFRAAARAALEAAREAGRG